MAGCGYSTFCRPCLRRQKSGIRSIGPGRYRATSAMMSSKQSGLACFSMSFMPRDSSWNTAVVLAALSRLKVGLSSSGKVSNASGSRPSNARWALVLSSAMARMVSVRRPRKSNFTRPTASTSSLSYWLTTLSLPGWQYMGEKSVILPGEISTPPACMPILRVRPSSRNASSSSSLTSSSFSRRSLNCGSFSSASARDMPSSLGISLAMPSTKLNGRSSTRPTSRITALAAMVPKVAICDTASRPYFCLT
ncbi:hypothetical protein GALL_537900 [mine drainage metagenome]|uniref:Uncharacterized protein n=1 Tax=mine drainage metagenome TaxID=410659 RepID=A0A1J5P0S5_9ZZZZ